MALIAGKTEVGLKETSSRTEVPANNQSRLMYYLNCICAVLQLDDDPQINRLKRYDQYPLTEDQLDQLLALCYLLSPDVLIDKVIFHNEELCGNGTNKFYDLTVARTELAAIDSIVIGGQRRQVRKIMVFKMGWIEKFWKDPMQALIEEKEHKAKAIEFEQERERSRQRDRDREIERAREEGRREERDKREREREIERYKELGRQEERQKQRDLEKSVENLTRNIEDMKKKQSGGGCCVIL